MRSIGHSGFRAIAAPEKGAAWLLVALFHLLAAWILIRPQPEARAIDPPMALVYIDLPTPAPVVEAVRPADTGTRATKARSTIVADASPAPAADNTPTAALQTTTASDDWSMPTTPGKDDGIRFERKSPMTSINPIRRGPPERFRMRQRPAGLADYVRALSQALLWPAGYSDDPCDGLAEAAQMLSGNATTKGRQALLEDVVRQQKQFCN